MKSQAIALLAFLAALSGAGSPRAWAIDFDNVDAADSCFQAAEISSNRNYTGSTALATADGGDAGCGNTAATQDVWYAYTPASSDQAVFSLCGSGYDTVVVLYTDCPTDGGVEAGCDDDGCDVGTSHLQTSVEGGRRYLIRVTGYLGSSGDFRLKVTGPASLHEVNSPTATETSTPTATVTSTPTSTSTATPTFFATETSTPTNTSTWTPTFFATETFTPTATATFFATNTSTPTATATFVPTETSTPTNTSTWTPTFFATETFTPTATATFFATNTSTPTATATFFPTETSTPTATATFFPTSTAMATATETATQTATATMAPTKFGNGWMFMDSKGRQESSLSSGRWSY